MVYTWNYYNTMSSILKEKNKFKIHYLTLAIFQGLSSHRAPGYWLLWWAAEI